MRIRRRDLLKLAGFSAAGAVGAAPKSASADEGSPIYRDVCIIGGGSAGTYAAVRLRDLGKSVLVVERQERLGGHAETYVDPDTGVPIDIGVVVVENLPIVTNYFGRFGVPLLPAGGFGDGETAYIDFTTGRTVSGYTPPDRGQTFGAVAAYQQILLQQFPYLDDGFQLPNPVPPDLLMPFGAFATKYGLEGMVNLAFQYGQGLGDTLNDPALYVLKLFSLNVVGSLLGGGFFVIPSGSATLYDAAAAFLGDDVLVDSRVIRVEREKRGPIRVWLDTPDGPRRVHCDKLVVAFPPTLTSLAPFDLDLVEFTLLNRFRPNHYSTGVVRLSGIEQSLSIQNTGRNTAYNLPRLPGIYGLSPTPVPGLWNVKYGSPTPLPDAYVRQAIGTEIRRINRAGTLPIELEGFEIFKNHQPFQQMVTPFEISAGFYTALNSLQGRRDTFYTGATFQTNDSSLIWRFTENLLPQIVG